jgi:glycosyltransferase involved in cell wall biosynthesis
VLSVSPVFQAHLAVLRAHDDLKGIPWFIWMHDPSAHYFVARGGLTILGSNPIGRYIARRRANWERKAIEKANRLIVTSQGLADAYRELLPHLRKPLLVPCGFDIEESYRASPSRSDKLVFVYVGTIYSQQTPRPIIESLARLMKAGLFRPEEIEVKFVGRLENEEGRQVLSVARELGLGDAVTSSPQVPHTEALRIIADATVGIAMAEQIVTQIPAKMFEYIALRKPVLALADGTTLDLVNENRIGYACQRDGLDTALTALISQWRHDGLAVFEPALEAAAKRYDMANIAKELLGEFRDEVAETARSGTRAEVPA